MLACNSGDNAASDDEWDMTKPYFIGKVIEVYEKSCLVEVTDTGNGHFWIGEQVKVHTNIPSCPEYAVGDFLRISFDGKVASSIPPQVTNVFLVSKVDCNSNK